jgi:hypothetical protein
MLLGHSANTRPRYVFLRHIVRVISDVKNIAQTIMTSKPLFKLNFFPDPPKIRASRQRDIIFPITRKIRLRAFGGFGRYLISFYNIYCGAIKVQKKINKIIHYPKLIEKRRGRCAVAVRVIYQKHINSRVYLHIKIKNVQIFVLYADKH